MKRIGERAKRRRRRALPNGSNPARTCVISIVSPRRAEIFALPAFRTVSPIRSLALSPASRLCYLLFARRSAGRIVPLTSPSPIR